MRRTFVFVALAGALALGGCSTLSAIGGFLSNEVGGQSVAQQAPVTIADAEKGLTVTHYAYEGVSIALMQAANMDLLHGANATTAQQLYDKVGDILTAADQADAAANAQGILDQVSAANALIVQIKALLPSRTTGATSWLARDPHNRLAYLNLTALH